MKYVLLLALVVAAPAAAQTQQQLNAEAARDHARADVRLNAAYRAAMARAREADAEQDVGPKPTNPNHAGALLAAQRAWLVFRDAECRTRGYAFFGGSMMPMQISACKEELTELRIEQLKPRPEGE